MLACPSYGQTSDLPSPLSFQEAVQIFLERNPDLKVSQAQAEQLGQEAKIRALWPNPSVSFERNQVSLREGGAVSENTFALEQPLRYPGEQLALRKAADRQIDAAYASYEEAAASLYEQLRVRYATALAARERLEVVQEVTDAVRRAVEIGEVRLQEGDISPFEHRRLRVVLATYEDALEVARNELRDAGIELAYFLTPDPHVGHHRAEEDQLVVAGSLVYEPRDLDYDALVGEALARRSLLAAAESRLQASRQILRAEQYARLPDLAIRAGYRNETEPGLAAPGFTLGLRVGLPVFHQRQPQVRSARAAATEARHQIEQARRRIELEIHDAFEHWTSFRNRIERISGDILLGSDELLEDALYVYEEGEIGLADLLDALEATKTSRLLKIELLLGHNLSRYAMEAALGVGPTDTSPFE